MWDIIIVWLKSEKIETSSSTIIVCFLRCFRSSLQTFSLYDTELSEDRMTKKIEDTSREHMYACLQNTTLAGWNQQRNSFISSAFLVNRCCLILWIMIPCIVEYDCIYIMIQMSRYVTPIYFRFSFVIWEWAASESKNDRKRYIVVTRQWSLPYFFFFI